MTRTSLRALAAATTATLLLVACGNDDDTAADDPTAPEQPDDGNGDENGETGCDATVPGSEITFGVFAPATRLDPTQESGALVGGTELAAVYDALMLFDPETSTYEPHVAESLEPNDDFTEWTLTLPEGVTYSDGTPLTAQLVNDNIDRYFEEGVRNAAGGYLARIAEREVRDERTLVLTLDDPWVEFPFAFADEPGRIVNIDAIGDDPDAFAAEPPDEAGLGPYVVERNAPGEELVLRARDDYWGGPVCIERIRVVFRPGATYEAYLADDLDVAYLRDSREIARARDDGESEMFFAQDAGTMILLNHAGVFADERLREAAVLAIDPEIVNDRAYEGTVITSRALISEESRFWSDAIEEPSGDRDRAVQLVEEAVADGVDPTVDLLCQTTPPSPDVAVAVAGMLEDVGFTVATRTLGTAEAVGDVIQGNFDGACWGLNFGPATTQRQVIFNLSSESPTNRIGYANPEMDAAILAFLAADDESDQQEVMADINRIFQEDFVSANIGVVEEGVVWKPNVHGIIGSASSVFHFHAAYLDE
jgi:peptide/nickel transport system substrate-binding protein